MTTCGKCGSTNAENASFCFSCEWPLKRAPGVAPKPARRKRTATSVSAVFSRAPELADAPVATTAQVACIACQGAVAVAARFCPHCGARRGGSDTMLAVPAPERREVINLAQARAVLDSRHRVNVLDPAGKMRLTFMVNATEVGCGRVKGTIVLDDPHVSPSHCVFRLKGDALSVEDLGSRNGVYIRIKKDTHLAPRAVFRAGAQLFMWEGELPYFDDRTNILEDDSTFVGSPPEEVNGRVVEVLAGGLVGDARRLRGGRLVIGRSDGTMLFPHDETMSGRHCELQVVGAKAMLRDLNSSNGTYVRISGEQPLRDGDELLVGRTHLRIEAF